MKQVSQAHNATFVVYQLVVEALQKEGEIQCNSGQSEVLYIWVVNHKQLSCIQEGRST